MDLGCTKQGIETGERSPSWRLQWQIFLLALGIGVAIFTAGCAGAAKGQSTDVSNPPKTTQTYSLSGTISPSRGGGATVALSGTTAMSTTADASGNFSFAGLANGIYAVTPSKSGYTFSPSTQAATVNGSNVSGLNFAATPQASPTFTISGTITPSTGGNGATVILSGATGATTTASSSGTYSFGGLANGTYAVSPNRAGFIFSPAEQTLTINGANAPGVNFAATAGQSYSVMLSWTPSVSTVAGYNIYRSSMSGAQYVRLNPSVVSGLTYSDPNVAESVTYYYVTTAVDASNNESGFSNEVPASIP
jgi:hypothetical protein